MDGPPLVSSTPYNPVFYAESYVDSVLEKCLVVYFLSIAHSITGQGLNYVMPDDGNASSDTVKLCVSLRSSCEKGKLAFGTNALQGVPDQKPMRRPASMLWAR